MWIDDYALAGAIGRWVGRLIAMSEPHDSTSDVVSPGPDGDGVAGPGPGREIEALRAYEAETAVEAEEDADLEE